MRELLPLGPESETSATRKSVDALLVVYSCRKYLDSRVRAVRETWLSQRMPRNCEVIIVVGETGTGETLPRDVVTLPCPDDYQSLCLKTLSMVQFATLHYDFNHLVKIDDDCYVPNVERLLAACDGADYIGFERIVRPSEGSADPKALPPPPTYMLGGCYALSGRAARFVAQHGQGIFCPEYDDAWEDLLVGRIIESSVATAGIELESRHDSRFASTVQPFLINCATLPQCVVMAHIPPKQMLRLHWLHAHLRSPLKALSTIFWALCTLLMRTVRKKKVEWPLDALAAQYR